MNTDGVAGLALGIFLIVVVMNGNSKKLLMLAERDASFLKWALALLVLVWLKNNTDAGGIFSALIFACFVALALTAGPNILQSATAFAKGLNGNG